jgi:hypothetical protein
MYAAFAVSPGFNPNADAEALHYAMLGSGCDEKKMAFLGARNPVELEAIRVTYQQKFGKDLLSEIKKETKGNFEKVSLQLFKDPLNFDVDVLQEAFKGAGFDHDAVIEVLVTKSNAQKQVLKDHYARKFGKDLVKVIESEASGNFRDFLTNLLIPRDESPQVVDNIAREDARTLYNAGEGKTGTDEKKFIHVLTRASFPHIGAIAKFYVADSKKHHTLAQAIESEFSGPLRTGLLAIVNIAEWGIIDYYAAQAMKAMKGAGTNDHQLIRVTLLQRGVMPAFKQHFRGKYGKSFKEWVHSETSGSYREILHAVIGDTN